MFTLCMNDFPIEIQKCVQDFLADRCFMVDVDGVKSREVKMDVGCVQGSVLGPRLFSIYSRHLEATLGNVEAKVITYADDSYVIVEAHSMENLKERAEKAFRQHNLFLKSIGMVTNVDKTEAVVFSKTLHSISLVVENQQIKTQDRMKVLGVVFTYNLNWIIQVQNVIRKAAGLLGRLRFMRRSLAQLQTLQIITAYYYPIVYYGSSVWMNSACLTSNEWRLLNTSHYKALRIAVGDHQRKWSREKLNETCQRATPKEWAHYTVASMVATVILTEEPKVLHDAIQQQMTVNDRKPGRPKFYDSSRLKVGRQSLQNRIGETATLISEVWISREISRDKLRIILKTAFFSYYKKSSGGVVKKI